MSIKLSYNKLLLYLFIIMPAVDSISGMFHETFNIGPLYRIIIFIYIFIMTLKYSPKRACAFSLILLSFMAFQFFANPYVATESLESTIKLFTPIEMLLLFSLNEKEECFSEKDVELLLDGWAIFYPISILFSALFGGNIFSYENEVGIKGFYYATNEISFVICVIVLCKIVQFAEHSKFKDLCLVFLNSICVILMGTKSGYMMLLFGLLLYIMYCIIKRARQKSISSILKGFIYIVLVAIAIIVVRDRIAETVDSILKRWEDNRIYISKSTLDFLSSGRLRRLSGCLKTWLNTEWWYPIIGWGLGTIDRQRENMEMDFLDLLFRSGITGFITVPAYYIFLTKKELHLDYWNIGCLIIAVIIVFFAGHTLFGGASGMALGILIIYCLNRSKKM